MSAPVDAASPTAPALPTVDAVDFVTNAERQAAHLRLLESEAIYILREVAAEFERPVLLFSGGKDSIVLLRLAELAFAPSRIPFAVMHALLESRLEGLADQVTDLVTRILTLQTKG